MASTAAVAGAGAGAGAGAIEREDDKFQTVQHLHHWLVQERKVDEEDLGDTASLLFKKGYAGRSTLLNITVEELSKYAGIEDPLARELCNKLKGNKKDEAIQKQMLEKQEKLLQLQKQMLEEQQEQNKTLKFSTVKSNWYKEALQKCSFKEMEVEWKNKPSKLPDKGKPYTWHPSSENSPTNQIGYMKYLEELSRPEETILHNTNSQASLLSTKLEVFDLKFSGNIDVVMVASQFRHMEAVGQNILMGIELKKPDNNSPQNHHQAVLQHIAASFLNYDTAVVTLLTDLNDRWKFIWFGKPKYVMFYVATSRAEAKYLIQHALDKEKVSAPTSFFERLSWEKMFPSIDGVAQEYADGNDDSTEGIGDESNTSEGNLGSQCGKTKGRQQRHKEDKNPKKKPRHAGGKQRAAREDRWLDYMDEEERRAAELHAVMQSAFCRMPELEEKKETKEDTVPSEISF